MSYFVMPGRSQHHQFCRKDSDCLAKGDFCRGRVCTNQTTVTCQTITEVFGIGTKFGDFSEMHGWMEGRPVLLTCD
ncbi:hypothetical protein FJT64_019728 [Amphibalanus amphitrite]|uniref:Uncharacterized protein n=1 Tax=Amphibalanus amphitrite TaxID=1232801 RepID=A0A6A4WQR7_AMPAM|nr:hypothetical protein FJT64_019728 [Amphibalanus amphitrite]